MIQQLYHVGAHGDFDLSYRPNWSPSGLPSMHDQDGSHAMTEAEIEELVEGFAEAARRAKEAGFDGCEIMAAYNALFEQFWAPFTNRRDDAWGGSFEKRMQFSARTLGRIRERCGPDFVIGVCVSVDPTRPDVLSVEDQQEIAAWHDERGLYDYVTVGTGSYFEFTRLMPTFVYEDKLGPPYAERIKQVGATREGAVGEPHPHSGERGLRHRVGAGGHGEHRARADCGPAHGEQGTRRARRGRTTVPVVQSDVLGKTLARLLDQLPGQSVRGPRVRVGRRPVRRGPTRRATCWWWVAVRPGSRRRGLRRSAVIA